MSAIIRKVYTKTLHLCPLQNYFLMDIVEFTSVITYLECFHALKEKKSLNIINNKFYVIH